MEQGTPEQAKLIRQVIRDGGPEQLDAVLRYHSRHRRARLHPRPRRGNGRQGAFAATSCYGKPPTATGMAKLAALAVDRQT